MANITAPDLSTAAKASADKSTVELDDAFGHAGNGLTALYEDPSVPQYQKSNFFRALGDKFYQGVIPTVATLTGQEDAQLALSGSNASDPVIAPAPSRKPMTPNTPTTPSTPSATNPQAEAEIRALKSQLDAVSKFVRDNGGTTVDGDLVASVNSVVTKKEQAAKVPTTDVVKKADIKANIETLERSIRTGNVTKRLGKAEVMVYSEEEATKISDSIDKIKALIG